MVFSFYMISWKKLTINYLNTKKKLIFKALRAELYQIIFFCSEFNFKDLFLLPEVELREIYYIVNLKT